MSLSKKQVKAGLQDMADVRGVQTQYKVERYRLAISMEDAKTYLELLKDSLPWWKKILVVGIGWAIDALQAAADELQGGSA